MAADDYESKVAVKPEWIHGVWGRTSDSLSICGPVNSNTLELLVSDQSVLLPPCECASCVANRTVLDTAPETQRSFIDPTRPVRVVMPGESPHQTLERWAADGGVEVVFERTRRCRCGETAEFEKRCYYCGAADRKLLEPPMCDLCNKPVDKLVVGYSPVTCETTYVVKCHGEGQSVVVTDEEAADRDGARLGRAFSPTQRRLANG